MKHLFILSISIIVLFSCSTLSPSLFRINRTNNSETKDFINQYRHNEKLVDTIILVDKVDMHEFDDCIENILQDISFIKESDKQIIKTQIKEPLIKKWDKNLLNNIKIVTRDTLNAIRKDKTKQWPYFYKYYGKRYYIFSAPIFFNKNTQCLFYSEYNCGRLCSAGKIDLYKKVNKKWVFVKSYCESIS